MMRLMITPFIVGWFLDPLMAAESNKIIPMIIKNSIIHIDNPEPAVAASIVYLS